MIGHKVRIALEQKAAREAAGLKPARRRTPKHLIYDIIPGTRPSVTRCARCGAIRQEVDGKLPPHRCES